MDNRNIFNTPQPNYYSYGGYPTTTAPLMRSEGPAYILPQPPAPATLKGRPVSSFEEARVAQIDLDGSISIFPDLGNKRIYTKRINADGTASILTYSLDEQPIETQSSDYVTQAELAELKATLDGIVEKLQNKKQTVNQPLNF